MNICIIHYHYLCLQNLPFERGKGSVRQAKCGANFWCSALGPCWHSGIDSESMKPKFSIYWMPKRPSPYFSQPAATPPPLKQKAYTATLPSVLHSKGEVTLQQASAQLSRGPQRGRLLLKHTFGYTRKNERKTSGNEVVGIECGH